MNRAQWLGSAVAAGVLLRTAGVATKFNRRPIAQSLRRSARGCSRAHCRDTDALRAFADGFEFAVAGLTPSVQQEVAQLFSLLHAPNARAAHRRTQAVASCVGRAIRAFLMRWRYSGMTTLRSGYDALHQLCGAAWYGKERSWPATGYPGPPKL